MYINVWVNLLNSEISFEMCENRMCCMYSFLRPFKLCKIYFIVENHWML